MLKDTLNNNENITPNSKELEILREHFPQCFDAAGVFDIKLFEEFAKTKDITIKKEGYSLNFLGKSYARYLSNLDSETVIVPDESNKDNPSENIYIVGDNLDALQHLKHSYSGAIKCIYIDPPYNTGSDGFVYNDKFDFTVEDLTKTIGVEDDEAQRILNMQGQSTHSAWLTFMYPRLELARSLLSEDGVIFISIDDNELQNLIGISNEIFGERNFIANLIWKSKSGGANDSRFFAVDHEYVLVYAKNSENLIIKMDKEATVTTVYNRHDDHGSYSLDRLDKQSIRYSPALDYEIIGPDGEIYKPQHKDPNHPNATWRWSKDRVKHNYEELVFENGCVYTKNYKKEGAIARSLLIEDRFGRTRTGKTDCYALLGGNYFSNPKPYKLINYFLSIFTEDNDLILDFFSGSATTAHAIMRNNVENSGKRKYIMVQLDEPVKKGSEAEKAGYKTIDEIGRERIRRAAKKLAADYPDKAKDCDLSFKTYYLKQTDKQTLDKIKDFDPALPLDSGDIIKAFGRDTILETWKIKDGYGFNAPVTKVDLKGNTAYLIQDIVHGANLYILDEISENQIMELVRKLEKAELVIDKVIEYGYALSYTANTSLRSNLKTLKNRNPIEVIIRY